MFAKPILPIAICLTCLLAAPSLGETRTWVGGAAEHPYSWVAQANWSPAGLPASSDTLTVTTGSPWIYVGQTNAMFEIYEGGSVTFSGMYVEAWSDIIGGTCIGSAFLNKRSGPGTLRIEKGAELNIDPKTGGVSSGSTTRVGYGQTGTLIVTGAYSRLDLPLGVITVGEQSQYTGPAGYGELQVLDGGKVTAEELRGGVGSGTGYIGVGAGSVLDLRMGCRIGVGGGATMLVGTGGTVKAGGDGLVIGDEATGQGWVTLNGGVAEVCRLRVGQSGAGWLTIKNGGRVDFLSNTDGGVEIGAAAGGFGKVVVTDDTSMLDAGPLNPIYVGNTNQGILEVRNAGTVAGKRVGVNLVRAMDDCSVLITGTDSMVRYDEDFNLNRGTLTVEAGGQLANWRRQDAPAPAVDYVGGPSGAGQATAIVRGAKSKWVAKTSGCATLVVGQAQNKGVLTIEDAGSVDFGRVIIGVESMGDGTVTVSGSTSELYVSGPVTGGIQWPVAFIVGYGGTGKLDVKAGGTAYVGGGGAQIGAQGGSDGQVLLSGAGLWHVGGSLYVGGTAAAQGGAGLLSLVGSTVTVTEDMKVWGSGTVKVGAGSIFTIKGQSLTLANKSQYQADPGAKIELLGTNLIIENDDPADVAGLADTTLVFAGGAGVTDDIELCGGDRGGAWSSFQDNFTIGRIEVGTATTPGCLRLANAFPNSGMPTEALYVRELVVRSGSSLDLNGMQVYALEYDDDGGQIIPGTGGGLSRIGAIQDVESTGLNATYTAPHGEEVRIPGTLRVLDDATVRWRSDSQAEVFADSEVDLKAYLVEDLSAGGLAAGRFEDGEITLRDADGEEYLSGVFLEMLLLTMPDGSLAGSAVVDVTSSIWRDAFPMGYNDEMRLDLTFSGAAVTDFGSDFSGWADVGLAPLPEPATLALLALGGLGAILRRRRATAG